MTKHSLESIVISLATSVHNTTHVIRFRLVLVTLSLSLSGEVFEWEPRCGWCEEVVGWFSLNSNIVWITLCAPGRDKWDVGRLEGDANDNPFRRARVRPTRPCVLMEFALAVCVPIMCFAAQCTGEIQPSVYLGAHSGAALCRCRQLVAECIPHNSSSTV